MRKLTKEDFTEVANKIHNNRYDYSKVVYTSDRIPIDIICSKHGIFSMTPLTHKNGGRCPKCIIEENKHAFIDKANLLHNNKYDYSLVEYKNNKTKVKIICPEHGEFLQRPDNHLHNGCPTCGRNERGLSQRLTQNEFLQKAIGIHGNKYIYDKTQYVKSDEKVIITCRKHGDFLQVANVHLSGSGCPKCKAEESKIRETSTKEEFINKAKIIHNDKYTYEKVNYVDGHTKVIITCPKHGDFAQKPCLHLNNQQGCPKCGIERMSESRKSNTEQFIDKAKKKHGDKFDYSNVDYVSATDIVEIICKEHGAFKQVATVHLRCKDGGCPECKKKLLGIENTDHLGNKFNSITDKCSYWNINKTTYSARIKLGWSEKEALTCPLKMSLGEYRIKNIFDKLNITYLYNSTIQKAIINENILDKYAEKEIRKNLYQIATKNEISSQTLSCLKYDFIVFSNNKPSFLLEFDGDQHFHYSSAFFKTIEEFSYRVLLDNVKIEIAQMLNIPLLRIRYDQIDKVEEIIKIIIKNPNGYKNKCNILLSNEEYWAPLNEYLKCIKLGTFNSKCNQTKINKR